MALEIRQSLKLSQQPIMTPQLQQAIKLLQLSRMELMDLVRQEEEENPILEEVAEPGRRPSPWRPIYETSAPLSGGRKEDPRGEMDIPPNDWIGATGYRSRGLEGRRRRRRPSHL